MELASCFSRALNQTWSEDSSRRSSQCRSVAQAARRNQSTWLCYVTGYRLGLCRRSGGDQERRLAAADGVGRRVTERTVARALAGAACEEKWGSPREPRRGRSRPVFLYLGEGGGGCKVRLFQIPKLFPYFVTSVRFLTTCPHPPPLHPPPFSSPKLSFSDRNTFFFLSSFSPRPPSRS